MNSRSDEDRPVIRTLYDHLAVNICLTFSIIQYDDSFDYLFDLDFF